MFAGKTRTLIERLRSDPPWLRAIFKPTIDGRYGHNRIVSHDGDWLPATEIPHTEPEKMLTYIRPEVRVVGIDEAQFFSSNIVPIVQDLARRVRVVVAGLDLDYRESAFGSVPTLRDMADEKVQVQAVCRCGQPANRTQRLVHIDDQVLVGGAKEYEARCQQCFCPTC